MCALGGRAGRTAYGLRRVRRLLWGVHALVVRLRVNRRRATVRIRRRQMRLDFVVFLRRRARGAEAVSVEVSTRILTDDSVSVPYVCTQSRSVRSHARAADPTERIGKDNRVEHAAQDLPANVQTSRDGTLPGVPPVARVRPVPRTYHLSGRAMQAPGTERGHSARRAVALPRQTAVKQRTGPFSGANETGNRFARSRAAQWRTAGVTMVGLVLHRLTVRHRLRFLGCGHRAWWWWCGGDLQRFALVRDCRRTRSFSETVCNSICIRFDWWKKDCVGCVCLFRDFLDFGESRGSLYFFRTQRHKYTTILNSLTNCILNTDYFSIQYCPYRKRIG